MIQTICICGAGTMGAGIAQVAAQSGFTTTVYDVNSDMLEKADRQIRQGLKLLIDKQKISEEEKNAVMSRIRFVNEIEACKADLIIEAIIEKLEVKVSLFNELASVNADTAILATNTSSLPVSEIAGAIKNPNRVAGMHFFNPAAVMKLVEIVKTDGTSDKTVDDLLVVAKTMGKVAVVCQDSPGFIVNHVARPYYLEALKLLEAAITDIETIDQLLESSGFKMGPFRLMDLIGNDINYAVSCSVYEALGKPERLRPSRIQEEKVKKEELGKKTGKGYYEYG
jgi:3-hydroxybutyryl-CoA dehydrogenase